MHGVNWRLVHTVQGRVGGGPDRGTEREPVHRGTVLAQTRRGCGDVAGVLKVSLPNWHLCVSKLCGDGIV